MRYKTATAFLLILILGPAFSQSDAPLTTERRERLISLVSISTAAACDTFTIGEQVQTITAKRSIFPFLINRFETSYQLWYDVLTAAQEAGYTFQNPGQEGSSGRRGREPTERGAFEPVTAINWRDAIVWCNALSELQNLVPCYTYNGKVLRNSAEAAECDLAECSWQANGYRLPSEAEWEYAARKKTDGAFQRGDLPSGIFNAAANADTALWGTVAWYAENTDRTKPMATAGTAGAASDVGLGKSNALGLFDMSGNVLEFCWDWKAAYTEVPDGQRAAGPAFGYERVSRGGSWSPYTPYILAADRYGFDPDESYNYLGFRFARTITE